MSTASGVKRLYKSRTERMIDGVCGGVAAYFNLDPTLVRIAWVLLTLMGGSGILLYIVAMIVMPKEPFVFPHAGGAAPQADEATSQGSGSTNSSKKNSMFWGVLLIVVGAVLFLSNLDIPLWHGWWWVDKGLVLSILLILVGVAFMWGGRNSMTSAAEQQEGTETASEGPEPQTEENNLRAKRLYRSYADKKLFGVCGGLGEYFNVDSTIVRLLFVIATVASSGLGLVAYVICAIVFPRQLPVYKT